MPNSTVPTRQKALIRQKATLRHELQRRRAGLAATTAAAEAVRQRLVDQIDLPAAAVVAGYWPLAAELDPRPAMAMLSGAGHSLALPRVGAPDAALTFHAWHDDDALIPGSFGVMEPSPARPRVEPGVVLVPLLGFDRRGRRLGWGKGYYDRTLAELRSGSPGVIAIGIAFAAQEVDEIPAGPTDQVLDLVVTEQAVHDVAGARGARGAPGASVGSP